MNLEAAKTKAGEQIVNKRLGQKLSHDDGEHF